MTEIFTFSLDLYFVFFNLHIIIFEVSFKFSIHFANL